MSNLDILTLQIDSDDINKLILILESSEKERYEKKTFKLNLMDLDIEKYKIKGNAYKPVGCDKCDSTGYKGRLSIGEYVSIDEKISEFIHNSASENEMSEYVFKNNKKIYENGLQVVANGDTSISELMRVIED